MAIKKTELYSSLWASCDELRGGMDASQYKDYVLTFLFLKYVSDAFEERQNELRKLFTEDDSDENIYYMPKEDYGSHEEYEQAVAEELELHDYYQEKNIFWVPPHSRWNTTGRDAWRTSPSPLQAALTYGSCQQQPSRA